MEKKWTRKWMWSVATAVFACGWVFAFVYRRYGWWEAMTVAMGMVYLASIIEIPFYRVLADKEEEF